ncbi:UBL3 [Cordylochernes scorpioides]|uniref:UBL3 n=1 Tax=Cordylochernes scorpioides TaxID=51811 RepID=A0ABY6L347_9ARAC|nr:UBL3 [Cordylochernes scorpioides]
MYYCHFVLDTKKWSEESVAKAEILRLIYQGRFLHGNVTLGALQLPLGRTTVMHLVPRENLPEPNSQGFSIFLLVLYDGLFFSKLNACL